MESMRKKWFAHVNKTRKRLQRKDKSATHRQAMKAASVTWPKEKVKIQNRIKRDQRKLEKEKKNLEESLGKLHVGKENSSTSVQSK